MVDMYKQIRAKSAPKAKLMCFLENCSIHKYQVARDAAGPKKANLWLQFNRPYRPDLNGIEFVWKDVKHRYRKRIDWCKANGRDFDHAALVKEIVEETDEQLVKDVATRGEANIWKALPTQRLFHEPEPAHDWEEHQKAVHQMQNQHRPIEQVDEESLSE